MPTVTGLDLGWEHIVSVPPLPQARKTYAVSSPFGVVVVTEDEARTAAVGATILTTELG